ncbi:actin organization and endocytosis protein [Coemansia sp. RSA 2322]|nr:actin organization and endocytosis protein [Coemansia sp. RSA 2322]
MNSQSAAGELTLGFIPAADAAAYASAFHSNVAGGSTRISGDAARRVLLQSRLTVSELGRIWELADMRRAGSLSLAEFMLAMHLAQSRIRGKALPEQLPAKVAAMVMGAGMAVSMPEPMNAAVSMPVPMGVGVSMGMGVGMGVGVGVGMGVSAPVSMPEPMMHAFEAQFPDIASESAPAPQWAQLASIRPQHEAAISPSERAQYEAVFRRCDAARRGVISGAQAREVFAQSGLAAGELARVWALADGANQGALNVDEFCVAMHVIFRRLAGAPVPAALPAALEPRSSRDFRASLQDMKAQLLVAPAGPVPRNNSAYSAYDDGAEGSDEADGTAAYQSAARRRARPEPRAEPAGREPAGRESADQLRRAVELRRGEAQRLRAANARRAAARAEARVAARWRIDELKREIEAVHRAAPEVAASGPAAELAAKRRRLAASVGEVLAIMPALARDYERIAGDLAAAARDVAQRRARAELPPADGVEARAARLVAQRMAALTGMPPDDDEGADVARDVARADRRLADDRDRLHAITGGVDRVAAAVRDVSTDAGRWDAAGGGVRSDEVRALLERLRGIARSAEASPAVRTSAFSPADPPRSDQAPQLAALPAAAAAAAAAPSIAERLARAASKQDRDRILQEIAEERFRERQRALGIPDPEPEPEAPAPRKPEMQERHALPPAALAPAFAASGPSAGSNPFALQPAAAAAAAPELGASPARGANGDGFSADSSSDEEWDSDDSSDDDDGAPAVLPTVFDVAAADSRQKVPDVSSPRSSVSFDTAFANHTPASLLPPKDEGNSNPFLGLIASAAAASALESKAAEADGESQPASFEVLRLRALYPYNPEDDADELTIETGDLIETRAVPADRLAAASGSSHAGGGWLFGEILRESPTDQGDGWLPSGRAGWFPRDYVETLGGPGSRGWIKTRARFGTAKYNYEPQHEDELSVAVGDRVRVVDGDTAESWWKVRKLVTSESSADEQQEASMPSGMLPAMYIDLDKI